MASSSYFTGITSSISTCFSMPFPSSFLFFRMEIFGRTYSSIASLRDDDLVKGFLILVLAAKGDEEKCSLLPLLAMALVEEGTSSSSSAGGGERPLCGEW
jgi:hypothetical protein